MKKRRGIQFQEIIFLTLFSIGGLFLFLNSPKQALKTESSIAESTAKVESSSVADSLNNISTEELQQKYGEALRKFNFSEAIRLLNALEKKGVPVKKEKLKTLFQAFLYEGTPNEYARKFQAECLNYGDSLSEDLQVMELFTRFYVSQGAPMSIIRQMLPLAEKEYYAALALGIWAIQSGQTEKAVKRLDKAVQLNPSSPEAYYFLYLLYKEKGEKDLAEIYKKKALTNFSPFEEKKLEQLKNLLN